jgi:uncharacterized Zn finger protein
MTVISSSHDPRSAKAIEIASSAGQWLKCRTADGSKRYGVPSQSVAGRYYLTDTRTCTCPDFQRHGGPCKHSAAVRLHVARIRAERARGEVVAAA